MHDDDLCTSFYSLMQMLMYQFVSENGEKDSVLRQVSNTWLGIVCSTCHSRRGNGTYCSSHFPSVQVEYVIIESLHIEWDKFLGCVELLAFQKSSILPFVFCEREKSIMFLKLVSLSSGFGVSGGACTAKCCRLARDSVQ